MNEYADGQVVWKTTEEPKGTVYVIVGAKWQGGDVAGSLLLDTGEPMWGHMSSSEGWLWRDLTQSFNDRRQQLAQRYPDGYSVVWCISDNHIPAEVLEANKAWHDAHPREEGKDEVKA